ncbi:MAG TPA: VOC family protein [Methanospirillum sp.]|nr:VOC family protein [Methanospirillum sp.]
MPDNQIHLDHIAIAVTNIERSKEFYKNLLRLEVADPISLRDQSAGLKYGHALVSHGPRIVKDLLIRSQPGAVQQMYTDICYCSIAQGRSHLILVQQTHPEKGYTRSVTGHTLYGFSCLLSPTVDTDDLGWDLSIADIPFQHGDMRSDGTIFSQNNTIHSLYIQEPDGRYIELTPIGDKASDNYITDTGHVVLYVNDIRKSINFYKDELSLADITPGHISKDPWKTRVAWLGVPEGSDPVIILMEVIQPDGTKIKAEGYGLDHYALSGVRPLGKGVQNPECIRRHEPDEKKSSSVWFKDPDGYYIECI